MFSRLKQRKLYKAILNQCVLHLDVYREEVKAAGEQFSTASAASTEEHFLSARRSYLNSVFDAMWEALPKGCAADARIRIAMSNPGITGLPPNFSLDYLAEFGFSAGVTFAFFYYALWGTPVQSVRVSRIMSKLNHKQNDLMNMVLAEFDDAAG